MPSWGSKVLIMPYGYVISGIWPIHDEFKLYLFFFSLIPLDPTLFIPIDNS